MANVTFRRECSSCGTSDDIEYMLLYTGEAEDKLYRNVVPSNDDDNDESSENFEQFPEFLSKDEMAELISESHERRGDYCEVCGNRFEFWDIKINGELLKDCDSEEDHLSHEEEPVDAIQRKKIPENDCQKLNLKENVKSIKEISYKTNVSASGVVSKSHIEREPHTSFYGDGREKDFFCLFSPEGNKMEEIFYNSEGTIVKRNKFRYDTEGHLIEEVFLDGNEKQLEKKIYTFNDIGKCIQGKLYDNGNIVISTVKYAYDAKGNRIEKAIYSAFGELESKGFFKRDIYGNVIEANFCNSQGNVKRRFCYEYDIRGNNIEKRHYNSENKLVTKWVYSYDNKDNLIEWKEFEAGSEYYQKKSYRYKYDRFNNWIGKIDYYGDDTPKCYMLERTIVYY